jgi:hypothetical protein
VRQGYFFGPGRCPSEGEYVKITAAVSQNSSDFEEFPVSLAAFSMQLASE